MTSADKVSHPDGIFEHEGLLWKPKPGATSTAAEFLDARSLFLELHDEARWNSWVLDDRAVDIERAFAVMEQWDRGEPGHRYLTKRQMDARLRKTSREFDKRRAADEARQAKDSARYDPELEHARLALLEKESRLAYELDEASKLRSGERYPAMDAGRRAEQVREHDESIEKLSAEVNRLTTIVGDPELVVDERGRLPSDRRAIMLTYFSSRRSVQVRDLRVRVPKLAAALKAMKDKEERSALRIEIDQATRRLEKLLAIPPLIADEMCSECATPAYLHGWVTPPTDGPCSAWPGCAAKIREVRQMIETFSRRKRAAEPAPPKPKPLAVIASGLPLNEVIERLTELQAKYPDCEVRPGRANRWELWPKTKEPAAKS